MTLVVFGPTATGKTDLAIELAKKFNGELISADSRQVYKSLDIGTGKVSFESTVQKKKNFWIVDGVKIYGFDLINPGEKFSASDFHKFALSKIAQIKKDNKLPIVVGGSGFYIKSIIIPFETLGIEQNPKLRTQLEKLSKKELLEMLKRLDPKKTESLNDSDRNNPRRLVRAIEVAKSKSKKQKTVSLDYKMIGLSAANNFLYNRADKWLETRLNSGLIEEIENLIKNCTDPKWLVSLGLEYRWITNYLLGKISKETAVERLRGDIHDFIRRQKTFFLQFPEIKKFDIQKKNYQKAIMDYVNDLKI